MCVLYLIYSDNVPLRPFSIYYTLFVVTFLTFFHGCIHQFSTLTYFSHPEYYAHLFLVAIVQSTSFLLASVYSKTFIAARHTKPRYGYIYANGRAVFLPCTHAVFECDPVNCRHNELTVILLVASVTGWGTVTREGG